MYTDRPWTFAGVQRCANEQEASNQGLGSGKTIPSASNPSTWGGLLWTGTARAEGSSNAEGGGQPAERLVVARQTEAQLVRRVGEGADVDAVMPQPLDHPRDVVMAYQPKERRGAHRREARGGEQLIEAPAIVLEPH